MFEIHFLNQGRVDAILIGCDGEWAFIDAGYRKNGVSSIEYMKKMGVTKQRYYIASHGHKNHIGGAAPIIEQLEPEMVIVPRAPVIDAIKRYAKGVAEKNAVNEVNYKILRREDSFMLGKAMFTCIGPMKFKNVSTGAYSENYNSMILLGKYGNRTVLLTGDTSDGILNAIDNDTPGSIKAEIYKNHHHTGSTSKKTLKRISPEFVAVCAGGLPSNSYQKNMKNLGIKWGSTSKKDMKNFCAKTSGLEWTIKEVR